MKEQSIVGEVINRLLSEPYPTELLGNSLAVLEEYAREKSYTNKEIEEYVPFLKKTDLKISTVRRIRKEMRKELVARINSFEENGSSIYEVAILMYALQVISYSSEKGKGIHKRNPKIGFCYDYVSMLLNICDMKEVEKMMKYLRNF